MNFKRGVSGCSFYLQQILYETMSNCLSIKSSR